MRVDQEGSKNESIYGACYVFLLFISLFLSSCDCYYEASGVVINHETGLPIVGVKISKTSPENIESAQEFFSDNSGQYTYHEISGTCHERTLYFSHPRFIVQKQTLANQSKDSVFLKPIDIDKGPRFSPEATFRIDDLKKSSDYPSSDANITQCGKFNLIPTQIDQIVKTAESIDTDEWHHAYDIFPCSYEFNIYQNGSLYKAIVNGGAWLAIESIDGNAYYGVNKDLWALFLSEPWQENVSIKQDGVKYYNPETNINTSLDTAMLFGIWASDLEGPHADFILSKESWFIVDYDGDGTMPYQLNDRTMIIQFPNAVTKLVVVALSADSLSLYNEEYEVTDTFYRWNN